ncbi:MAG: hemolysin III family protein [Balneolaceae bacterium]|nr:hemolysin III family protein [Balneolaceae bacterium]MBO6545591.1 hemolysin III family protein [Balneolaceae bacterium]MBO6646987.1 hemolysin III family protein [Balneolaceae bacterium]
MSKYFFPVREPFNAYSHLAGAIISVIWTVLLLINAVESPISYKISFIIYGVTVFLMFFSSAVYHSINVTFKTEELFRLFDHIMIYLVIAGSYTPMCVIVLDGGWRLGMLLGIWLFALAGVFKKIFWLNAPRWFSTALYLLMGWVAVIIFPQMWELLPKMFSYWIVIGGLFYSFGAVIYAIEKPNPLPPHFEFHELWHLFVLGGAFSHFWAIYKYLPAYS